MAVATSMNTTGHCSSHHAHVNAGPRRSRVATCSATVGPAMTRNIDTTMKSASATVSTTAITRVFHHGRDSVTSYAALSVVMIDTIAPELDQIVTRKPNVRIPPLFCFDSDVIAPVTISIAACGAIRDSIATTSFTS